MRPYDRGGWATPRPIWETWGKNREENTYRTACDPTRRNDLPQSAGADFWETGRRSKGLASIARPAVRREESRENCLLETALVAMRAATGVMMSSVESNMYRVLNNCIFEIPL